MRNKIKLLRKYRDVMMNLEVPQEMNNFNEDLIQWLENSVARAFNPFMTKTGLIGQKTATSTFDQTALSDEFCISKTGDIFK